MYACLKHAFYIQLSRGTVNPIHLLSVKLIFFYLNVAGHSFPFNLENNQIKEGRSCQRNLGLVDHASSSNIEKSTSFILYLLCYAIIWFDSMFVIHVHSEINKRETFFFLKDLMLTLLRGRYIFLMWCKQFVDWKWWMLQNTCISSCKVLHSAYTFLQYSKIKYKVLQVFNN